MNQQHIRAAHTWSCLPTLIRDCNINWSFKIDLKLRLVNVNGAPFYEQWIITSAKEVMVLLVCVYVLI